MDIIIYEEKILNITYSSKDAPKPLKPFKKVPRRSVAGPIIPWEDKIVLPQRIVDNQDLLSIQQYLYMPLENKDNRQLCDKENTCRYVFYMKFNNQVDPNKSIHIFFKYNEHKEKLDVRVTYDPINEFNAYAYNKKPLIECDTKLENESKYLNLDIVTLVEKRNNFVNLYKNLHKDFKWKKNKKYKGIFKSIGKHNTEE